MRNVENIPVVHEVVIYLRSGWLRRLFISLLDEKANSEEMLIAQSFIFIMQS